MQRFELDGANPTRQDLEKWETHLGHIQKATRPSSPCNQEYHNECPFVRHCDETIGLWVIDENPHDVDIEWIRKHAYRIGITDIDP